MHSLAVQATSPTRKIPMCNLFANITPSNDLQEHFNVLPANNHLGNMPALTAIYPGHEAPVVRVAGNEERQLARMNWGFLTPNYSKRDGKPIKPRIWNNARDDKLMSAPLWRSSFHQHRCLIPATSYCETKGRQPAEHFWFGMPAEDPDDRPLFALAGLWREEELSISGDLEAGVNSDLKINHIVD
ncbi:MAG: SOS response-associated peptidase family protein [Paracoccaceae bacterium]|nr:SOS response-associated peptidase family protein [Paracoccaceae bacterium]MDE2917845.1 SOS response-associated peptidase family protein [Paracoccaceae bacterium]